MHSFAACAGQTHSSAVGAMHSCVDTLECAGLIMSPCPLKSAPFRGRPGSPSNTWFLGPTGVSPLPPNGTLISSPVFAQLTPLPNTRTLKHTDHATCYICSNRPRITARRCASAVLAVIVCPSVCLSQIGVLLRLLNLGSRKQRRTIAQGLYFSDAKDIDKISTESPPTGATNRGEVASNRRFSTISLSN